MLRTMGFLVHTFEYNILETFLNLLPGIPAMPGISIDRDQHSYNAAAFFTPAAW
jgi:hypothetical protein